MLSKLLIAVALPTLALADSVVTIINSCSVTVNAQLLGVNNGVQNPAPLLPGARTKVTLNGGFDGIIYANTGGGNEGQIGATKAAFTLSSNYYYILTDSGFNFGISIDADAAQTGGFCSSATCSVADCTDTFHTKPTLPAPTSPPAFPLHQCTGTNTPYTVTFCPGATPPASVQIHPNGNNAKCVDVRAALFNDGTAVQIFDCNGSNAQQWVINRNDTKVQLLGTNFCLDAGTNPANNVPMKIWTCFAGLPAQAWFYTGDNRIAVTGKGQCLDLTNGNSSNTNQLQTFQCTTGNTNQIWTTTPS